MPAKSEKAVAARSARHRRKTPANEWSYDEARRIRDNERDHALNVEEHDWPSARAIEGWKREEDHLFRFIENGPLRTVHGASRRVDHEIATPLRESLLRFPSSPRRGVERRHEYHDSPGKPLSMHTLRVLTAREPPVRIEQIFLFNNGLNELDRTGLYYQLASSIIDASGGRAACILRPFPGHLTRARHARFAE